MSCLMPLIATLVSGRGCAECGKSRHSTPPRRHQVRASSRRHLPLPAAVVPPQPSLAIPATTVALAPRPACSASDLSLGHRTMRRHHQIGPHFVWVWKCPGAPRDGRLKENGTLGEPRSLTKGSLRCAGAPRYADPERDWSPPSFLVYTQSARAEGWNLWPFRLQTSAPSRSFEILRVGCPNRFSTAISLQLIGAGCP